jgi:hypothetical protein
LRQPTVETEGMPPNPDDHQAITPRAGCPDLRRHPLMAGGELAGLGEGLAFGESGSTGGLALGVRVVETDSRCISNSLLID